MFIKGGASFTEIHFCQMDNFSEVQNIDPKLYAIWQGGFFCRFLVPTFVNIGVGGIVMNALT